MSELFDFAPKTAPFFENGSITVGRKLGGGSLFKAGLVKELK